MSLCDRCEALCKNGLDDNADCGGFTINGVNVGFRRKK